ncbi:MAG: hypothetical protein ABL934_14665 [Lysobacteraceae bacterium]
MHILQNHWFRVITIAVCSVVVATGCIIERRNLIGPGYARLEPNNYCPGDTLTASVDFLGADVCPPDASCESFFPIVALSSTPTAFPPQSITNYTGNVSFTAPDADRVSVLFNPDRDSVLIPTAEVRPDGRVFAQRESLDQTRVATRIAMVNRELVHGGMCAGSTPVNSSQPLPGLPQFSPNLRLTDLCNVNSVAVVVTLSGGADGSSFSQTLSPGQCLASMPGVPTSTESARAVEVRPVVVDPGARCTATGPNMPPPPLRTLARMSCR